MANKASINASGGPVSWSITISHLKVALYRALLIDSDDKVIEKWSDQRTADSKPDTFQMNTPPSQLSGCVLWWQAIVMDPSDAGGPYVGTVTIEQDNNTICEESASSNVPPGKGKMDLFADEIKFS